MPFVKGRSGNPGGRPKATKMTLSIRARARVDCHLAYDALLLGLVDEKQRVTAAVNILRLAGISFQSEAEENKTIATTPPASKATIPELEAFVGAPAMPLN